MELFPKIKLLGEAAQYDICAACGPQASRVAGPLGRWIYPAILPDGKTVLLLKVLMTNACENNCLYCINRTSLDTPRTTFLPEELASLFMEMYRRQLVHGLFLSSAVSQSADATMTRMIKTVEILRFKYRFRGYIHLKILPGASFNCVERAVQLATRVSINLEAPNKERLAKICQRKNFEEGIIRRIEWIKKLSTENNLLSAGQTTQFVVGAAGESDKEILETTSHLYSDFNLARVYFSAFQPIENTPLGNHPPTPLLREHRLYQADFLFRRYGFQFEEIFFDERGNLPCDRDPKMVWALNHPEKFPVEINKATREELLRVPGIGPRSANRIIKTRSREKFHSLEEMKKTGAVVSRASSFILVNGKMPRESHQLSLSL